MYSVFAPVVASQFRKSLATNSGPLSERRCSGTPFITITSASALMTRDDDHRRCARTSRLSRVCSSIRLRSRTLRPTEVGLLHDPCILACLRSRLPVRHCHFDLTQQIYHLLRLVLLTSSHMLSLSS